MIVQYRPDIARAAEETVSNIKELETRLEVIKNDLAWLCQSIGHLPAAQLALTPVRGLAMGIPGVPTVSPYGGSFVPNVAPIGLPQTGTQAPWAVPAFGAAGAIAPHLQSALAQQLQAALAQQLQSGLAYTAGVNPFLAAGIPSLSPLATLPFYAPVR